MEDESVVVIGSGPTGAAAARRLIAQGVAVTMLEAGSDDPGGALVRVGGRNVFRRTPNVGYETDFVSTGHPDTAWFRTLEPGGCSNQWTGAVPRFAPEDFTDGERIDERYRWPLDYEELEPFYEIVERLLGITAGRQDVPQLPAGRSDHKGTLPRDWQAVAGHMATRGQGLTVLPLADGPHFLVCRRATAFNSYSKIVRDLESSPRFALRRGCVAQRLEVSRNGRQVESVMYHDRDANCERRVAAAAVVVACGPLRSTKLLFDSACPDFPDGLGNSKGILGHYLHDHPREWWSVDLDRPISRLVPAGYLTRRPFHESIPLRSTSWTISVTSERERALSFLPGKSRSVGVQVFGSMTPSERYFVRPSPDSKGSFGLPQLEIHLDFDADVIANVSAARMWFVDLMAEAGYRGVLNPVVPQCVPGAAVHYGGTARMHRKSEFGVVDRWSRLFDAPNVIVADAATFTTSSEKNPTLTAMALATRAADRLAYDLMHGHADD